VNESSRTKITLQYTQALANLSLDISKIAQEVEKERESLSLVMKQKGLMNQLYLPRKREHLILMQNYLVRLSEVVQMYSDLRDWMIRLSTTKEKSS